ncbi:AraC family transcriptional regulator [Bradyrhizobium oligotrophicum]|uniref:AraC family transcriptional regulator n=1 Tax=Bradyrhizobium oligotrophicum TaxID=44255 RepID=UPI003EB69CF6
MHHEQLPENASSRKRAASVSASRMRPGGSRQGAHCYAIRTLWPHSLKSSEVTVVDLQRSVSHQLIASFNCDAGSAMESSSTRQISLECSPDHGPDSHREWQRKIEEITGGIRINFADLKPLSEGPARIQMGAVTIGGLNINRWSLSPLLLDRTQKHLAKAQDVFSIPIPRSGRLLLTQRRQEDDCAREETRFLRLSERLRFHAPEGLELTGFTIPAAMLLKRLPAADDLILRRISMRDPAFGLLADYLGFAEKEAARANPTLKQLMADQLIELTVHLLAPSNDTMEVVRNGALKDLRREKVLRQIREHFANPDFSLSSAAAASGLSRSYIQKLFDEAGTSFSETLRKMRVEKAVELLRSPAHSALSVAEIAMDTGFADLSTFNRTFRRFYGETPTAIRLATDDVAGAEPAPPVSATAAHTRADR